jgi:hypothetical protein
MSQDERLLHFCSHVSSTGPRKRRCRKKYCFKCLARHYSRGDGPSKYFGVAAHAGSLFETPSRDPQQALGTEDGWACPACMGECTCTRCLKEIEAAKEREQKTEEALPEKQQSGEEGMNQTAPAVSLQVQIELQRAYEAAQRSAEKGSREHGLQQSRQQQYAYADASVVLPMSTPTSPSSSSDSGSPFASPRNLLQKKRVTFSDEHTNAINAAAAHE